MNRIYFHYFIQSLFALMLIYGCKNEKKSASDNQDIQIHCTVNKGSFQLADTVLMHIEIANTSSEKIQIDSLVATIRNISEKNDTVIGKYTIAVNKKIKSRDSLVFDRLELLKITEGMPYDAFGVFIDLVTPDSSRLNTYQTFFRKVDNQMLTCFLIEKENYKGLDIFKLDGGMSAEYVIEKAAANILGGISHSWKVNAPGSGPNHVYATPQFLENSVNETVRFYNDVLGNDKAIETVIVSPGIPSLPYISNALKAPVLPLHFLVSANSVKEIQSVLSYSNQKDICSYATLSHDPSVPYAVAWVKLLDLPRQYLDFIAQHKVRNVIILGATGTSESGETKSKKILNGNSSSEYQAGDIFIMYPGTSPNDVETLNKKIVDLSCFKQQDEYVHIHDWESGINQQQITNFGKSVSSNVHGAKLVELTANDLGDLYNLGTFITLAYMHKNKEKLSSHGSSLKGIAFNPYLLAHPAYEFKNGYLPVVYWQLIPPQWTIDRVIKKMAPVIQNYFPGTQFEKLNYWVNSSRNFGAEASAVEFKRVLIKNGLKNIKTNDYLQDEVWNPSDGMQSISEKVADEIIICGSADSFKSWNNLLETLTMDDLQNLVNQLEGITFSVKSNSTN